MDKIRSNLHAGQYADNVPSDHGQGQALMEPFLLPRVTWHINKFLCKAAQERRLTYCVNFKNYSQRTPKQYQQYLAKIIIIAYCFVKTYQLWLNLSKAVKESNILNIRRIKWWFEVWKTPNL